LIKLQDVWGGRFVIGLREESLEGVIGGMGKGIHGEVDRSGREFR